TLKKIPLPYHIFEQKYIAMINDSFLTNQRVTVLPPRGSDFKNRIGVAGIPMLLQKYEDGRMDVVITGVEKVRLVEKAQSIPYMQYRYEKVFENEKVTLREDISLLRELLWSEISKQPHFETQKSQLRKILQDPESIINYTILLMVKNIQEREKLMVINSFDAKVKLLIDILAPKRYDLSPFLHPIIMGDSP
ncbi:MAG: LON peptidase substrate-binding domain-containing protein, partial [Bacteriovoracaceae bacterium]